MRKIKYIGSWHTCGTEGRGYEFTNFGEACKTMRSICIDSTPWGNRAEWRVRDLDNRTLREGYVCKGVEDDLLQTWSVPSRGRARAWWGDGSVRLVADDLTAMP